MKENRLNLGKEGRQRIVSVEKKRKRRRGRGGEGKGGTGPAGGFRFSLAFPHLLPLPPAFHSPLQYAPRFQPSLPPPVLQLPLPVHPPTSEHLPCVPSVRRPLEPLLHDAARQVVARGRSHRRAVVRVFGVLGGAVLLGRGKGGCGAEVEPAEAGGGVGRGIAGTGKGGQVRLGVEVGVHEEELGGVAESANEGGVPVEELGLDDHRGLLVSLGGLRHYLAGELGGRESPVLQLAHLQHARGQSSRAGLRQNSAAGGLQLEVDDLKLLEKAGIGSKVGPSGADELQRLLEVPPVFQHQVRDRAQAAPAQALERVNEDSLAGSQSFVYERGYLENNDASRVEDLEVGVVEPGVGEVPRKKRERKKERERKEGEKKKKKKKKKERRREEEEDEKKRRGGDEKEEVGGGRREEKKDGGGGEEGEEEEEEEKARVVSQNTK